MTLSRTGVSSGSATFSFASVPAALLSDEELLRRSTALYQIGEVRIAQGGIALGRRRLAQRPDHGNFIWNRKNEAR